MLSIFFDEEGIFATFCSYDNKTSFVYIVKWRQIIKEIAIKQTELTEQKKWKSNGRKEIYRLNTPRTINSNRYELDIQ